MLKLMWMSDTSYWVYIHISEVYCAIPVWLHELHPSDQQCARRQWHSHLGSCVLHKHHKGTCLSASRRPIPTIPFYTPPPTSPPHATTSSSFSCPVCSFKPSLFSLLLGPRGDVIDNLFYPFTLLRMSIASPPANRLNVIFTQLLSNVD